MKYYRQYKEDAIIHEISKAVALERLGDAYTNPDVLLMHATREAPAQTLFAYYWMEKDEEDNSLNKWGLR